MPEKLIENSTHAPHTLHEGATHREVTLHQDGGSGATPPPPRKRSVAGKIMLLLAIIVGVAAFISWRSSGKKTQAASAAQAERSPGARCRW